MRLDAATLRAEAEAHRARQESPLWSDDRGGRDGDWTAQLNPQAQLAMNLQGRAERRTVPSERKESPPIPAEPEVRRPSAHASESVSAPHPPDIVPRLDALDHAVEKLAAAISSRPVEAGDTAGWLASAAGDPHTYDAPDPARRAFCVRLLPGTYERLQRIQQKLALRTTAGAWELLLRLGLAAVAKINEE